MVELTVETQGMEEVSGFLQDFHALLNNRTPLLTMLGQVVRDNIKADFERGGSPAGAGPGLEGAGPWQSTDRRYAVWEGKSGQHPLVWTGKLKRSIKYQITGEGVEIGSPLPYAKIVMTGGKTRYARRGFPWAKGGKVVEPLSGKAPRGMRAFTTNLWARPYLGVYGRDMTEFVSRLKLRLAAKRGSA